MGFNVRQLADRMGEGSSLTQGHKYVHLESPGQVAAINLPSCQHAEFSRRLTFIQEELELDSASLRDWLCQTYFDDDKKPSFSRRDIDTLGDLLDSMMQYRPSDRPQVSDLLDDVWFQRDPFDPLRK